MKPRTIEKIKKMSEHLSPSDEYWRGFIDGLRYTLGEAHRYESHRMNPQELESK